MAPNIDPGVASTIVATLVYRRDGASLDDIVAGFPEPRDRRAVEQWVAELVAADIIDADESKPPRYRAKRKAAAYLPGDVVVPGRDARHLASGSAGPVDSASEGSAKSAPPPAAPSPLAPSIQASSGPTSAESQFRSLFDEAMPRILIGIMPRASARAFLQSFAARSLPPGAQASFVEYGIGRLAYLGLGDARVRGIDPAQYELWRCAYFPADSAASPDASAPAAPSSRSTSPATSPGASPATARKGGRRVAGSVSDSPFDSGLPAPYNDEPVNDMARAPESFAKTLAKVAVDPLAKALEPVLPAGAGRGVRTILVTLCGTLLLALLHWLGSSPWLLAGTMVAVLGTLVAVAKLRAKPANSADGDPARGSTAAPASRTTRALLWAGLVAGLAIVAGVIWYVRSRQHPSTADVRAYVTSSLAPAPVQVAALQVTYGSSTGMTCRVTYEAEVVTTQPLFRRIDSMEYLRNHAATQMAAIEAAAATLRGSTGARVRKLVATEAPTPAPSELILLRTQTPPRTAALLTGSVLAWRQDGSWNFTADASLRREPVKLPEAFAGEARPAGPAVFAVDITADATRLDRLIADHAAYAAKVQAAATSLVTEFDRDRQQWTETFLQLLRPGTLLAGVAADGRGERQRIVVEIAENSAAARQVTALLHNDGGWAEPRTYRGDWSVADGGEACTLTLRTRSADRIEGAGPLLDDRGEAAAVLEVRSDGTVRTVSGNWQVRRLDAEAAAAVKAEWTKTMTDALAATKPGVVYRGTATRKLGMASETLLLRFTDQDGEAGLVRATLESANSATWSRIFRGSIVGNNYRAGLLPIRLRSADGDRVKQADRGSVLGFDTTNERFTMALRIDGDRLIGENEWFTFEFVRAAPASVGADPAAPRPALFEGNQPATNVAPPTSAPGDPLRTRPANPAATSADANHAVATHAQQVPGEPAQHDPATHTGSASLPPYPTAVGAYALVDGRWTSLPRNNGHVVQTLVQRLNASVTKLDQMENAAVGKSSTVSDTLAGTLTFDGKDAAPTTAAKDLVIVYVGALERPPAKDLARYPILEKYPAMEIARATLQSKGLRRVPLYLIAPGYMAFASASLAAKIEQPEPNILLLRPTAPLSPGLYALACGAQAFEFTVE